MPVVILGAAISAVAAGSAFVGGALAIGFSWTSFAGSLILGGLSYALTPKPKKPDLSNSALQNSSSTVAIRQSDLTRQHVYGHTRVTRGYAQMTSTGVNGQLHAIMILCEGELRAINEIWIDDYCVPNDAIDGSGNVTSGRYAGKLVIRKHLGSPTQTADTLAISNIALWDSTCTLSGIAYLYLILTKDQDIYPSGMPNFTAIIEGPVLYDDRIDDFRWSTNTAQQCADFIRSSDYGFGAFDDDIDADNIAAQENICDEIVAVTQQGFLVDAIDTATDIITLDGDLLSLQFGDQVMVSSNGTLPGGLSGSANYYVIPYQIKTTPRILLAASFNDAMAKIAVDITDAGTGIINVNLTGEPRYHGGGVMDTNSNLSDTLNDLVSCMAGRAVNVSGQWTLLAGAWRTPDITYGIGDIRGQGLGLKNALSMAENYNVVQGLFISPLTLYQTTNYPSARYQTFIDDDNGIEQSKDLNLPFCTRPTTAQRIAKIELFRGRQDIVFTSNFSMKGYQSKPGDTVALTIDRLGWDAKAFEVTEFAFDVNDGALQTIMTLRETAQAIYDWTNGEAITFDPAPNTNLPDPFTVPVIGLIGLDSVPIYTSSGDKTVKIAMTWPLVNDGFVVNDGKIEIQYKLSAAVDWIAYPLINGDRVSADLFQTQLGEYYDIRIRAINRIGVRGAWNTVLNFLSGSALIPDSRDWEFQTLTTQDWEVDSDPSEDWE